MQKVELLSSVCNDLICCTTGLNVAAITQHRFSTRFEAMLQNKLHVFVARFTVPKLKIKNSKKFCSPIFNENNNRES